MESEFFAFIEKEIHNLEKDTIFQLLLLSHYVMIMISGLTVMVHDVMLKLLKWLITYEIASDVS